MARRSRPQERYHALRDRLAAGAVTSINDAVTLNLDLQRFADDVITSSEGPELVRAFWQALKNISILDPTCGSGAFLFAALNVLHPLYEACLDGMHGFLADIESSARSRPPETLQTFRDVLADIDRHANRAYFIFTTIVLKNLFGVDIMEEAVEICKLRLFLKLVAQLTTYNEIEPLPDIDFNVRTGNTLVGFTSSGAIRAALERTATGQQRILSRKQQDALDQIGNQAAAAAATFDRFRAQQTDGNAQSLSNALKAEMRERLTDLRQQLDEYLARQFDTARQQDHEEWISEHQPFHWFIEFFTQIHDGGFDVIIGNPPYVEVPKKLERELLRSTYVTALERWSRDEDLYTFVLERSFALLASNGRFGMIVPLSVTFSTKRPYTQLRRFIQGQAASWWFSHFDRIPSALFGNDVRTRCTIGLAARSDRYQAYTTPLLRWASEARDQLFNLIAYARLDVPIEAGIPKAGSQRQADALASLLAADRPLAIDLRNTVSYSELADVAPRFPRSCVFVGGTAYNWFPAWRDIPETYGEDGSPSLPARTIGYRFPDEKTADAVFALLCSSLGYWWWAISSDAFNLKKWLVERFPIAESTLPSAARDELAHLGKILRRALQEQYVYKDNKGRVGNFYLPACQREIAAIDAALSRHVPGLSEAVFADIRAFNAAFSRADMSGETSS